MRNVNKLFYTTIALTLTSFLMRTVGVWFNVYLTGLVGSVGMGIFQLIMTVYALAKTLACGGMNLAATRLCIDDFDHRRHSMRRILLTALLLGIISFAALFFLSDPISRYWIQSEKASLSLKVLAFSLPFISLSAALNGYMTAVRKMSRYSVIQLLEQIAKISLTALIVGKVGNPGTELSIALVSLAISVSEVFSFALAFFSYARDMTRFRVTKKGNGGFLRRMTRLAIPDALGACIRSGLNTVEHLLIPRGIRSSGASADKAFSEYGIVQGMALPILLYPSSILGVISGLLVPEIAECKMKKNIIQVDYIVNRVLHVSLIFSMVTMAAMLTFSKELSLAIFGTGEAAFFIRLISPLIPIMYLDMTTDGMLKGLDKQLDIMKINVIDSLLCVVLVWILVPKMAVEGYIVTIYAAEIINFILSFYKLGRASGLHFELGKNFIKPLLCSFLAMTLAKMLPAITKKTTPDLILSISIGIVLYLVMMRLCRGITKEDSRWFRKLLKP